MPVEIEIKYKLDDPAEMRARLQTAGGIPRGAVFEENRLYDFADGRLRAAEAVLRVRVERANPVSSIAGARLTFKQRLAPGPGALAAKHCTEFETRLEDAAEMDGILAGLGLMPRLVYEKRREKWKLADCAVVLDELPRLGWFIEIEAALDSQLAWACRELTLGGSSIPDTYPALTERHGDLDGAGVRVLRFATGA